LTFRLLFVGDVVGPAGCSAVLDLVPNLREQLGLDAVVANAENSAPGGRGITKESGGALLSVADFLTLGNHAFDAEGYEEFLEAEERVARPANLGENLPGRGWGTFEADGVKVGVASVLGQVFIDWTPASPFEAADRAVAELEARGADLVLVDAHAEATSEKQALGQHLARRVHDRLRGEHHRVRPGGFSRAVFGGATKAPGGDAGAGALQRRAYRFRPRRATGRGDRAGSQGVDALARERGSVGADPFTMVVGRCAHTWVD
jgi:calcineurin-like phosphoesterase